MFSSGESRAFIDMQRRSTSLAQMMAEYLTDNYAASSCSRLR